MNEVPDPSWKFGDDAYDSSYLPSEDAMFEFLQWDADEELLNEERDHAIDRYEANLQYNGGR